MRGWVYVISNQSYPLLVKVGFTHKDPKNRAKELNTEGVPHEPVVEYDVLVDAPEKIERKVHQALAKFHENKEFFKCTAEQAVAIIREVIGEGIIIEKFHKVNAEKVLLLEKEMIRTQKAQEEQLESKQKLRIRQEIALHKKVTPGQVVQSTQLPRLDELEINNYKQDQGQGFWINRFKKMLIIVCSLIIASVAWGVCSQIKF